jgi:rubredoxin
MKIVVSDSKNYRTDLPSIAAPPCSAIHGHYCRLEAKYTIALIADMLGIGSSENFVDLQDVIDEIQKQKSQRNSPVPVPMYLTCPKCNARHIDTGEFATKSHHTHSCQSCGLTWRPAVVPTVGVEFLPGFKNEDI